MNKKWQIAEKIDDNFIQKFPEIDLKILQLLYNRGIDSQDKIDMFLTPDYGTDLRNPFLFKDMECAVERIFKSLINGEKITIFGDYDADGVTAAVVLKKVLEKIGKGGIIDVYIPHRGREGYGLNKNALKYIKENGSSLVITVDCGISNYEEVEYGKSLGLDIIITDHHQPPEKLPEAHAILNPKVKDSNYPFKELAGVGVAFKLAQALIQEIKKTIKQENNKSMNHENNETMNHESNETMNHENKGTKKQENNKTIKQREQELGSGNLKSDLPAQAGILNQKSLEGFEKWLLDLVAIGTIADLCPLVDENRVLVKYGLIVLNKTKIIGLRALFDVAGLPAQAGIAKSCESDVRCGEESQKSVKSVKSKVVEDGEVSSIKYQVSSDRKFCEGENLKSKICNLKSKLIDTWNVGFQIAPRLNAAGRLSHANTSFKLLTTEDENEAFNIARELNDTNNKRQILTKNATEEAIEIIKKEGQENNLAVFAKNKNWEPGIIGLVAGKLVEHYNKPAFVFTKIDNELVASGRSIPEFNIMNALSGQDKNKKSPASFLKRYGGHSQACGFSLEKEEYYEEFVKSFLEIADNELKGKDLSPSLYIDGEINVEEVNWDLRDSLESFAPFGQINPQPLFAIKNLEILDIKAVGKEGNHLKLKFRKGGSSIGAIGFSMNNDERLWAEKLHIGDKIDAVCYIEVNEWNGNREIQLKIVDLRAV